MVLLSNFRLGQDRLLLSLINWPLTNYDTRIIRRCVFQILRSLLVGSFGWFIPVAPTWSIGHP
jgi:hypothetical protein